MSSEITHDTLGAGSGDTTERRYQAILRLDKALSKCRTPEDFAAILSEQMRDCLQFLKFYIVVYGEEFNEELWAVTGELECITNLPVQHRPSWRAYASQEPFYIRDWDTDETVPAILKQQISDQRLHPSSLLFVPLTTAQWRLGALGVSAAPATVYNAEDIRFLRLVSSVVATALSEVCNLSDSEESWRESQHRTAQLQRTDRELREVIESIPAMAWSATADGAADFFNRRWLEYAGLAEDEARGVGWTNALHPNDLNGLLKYWQELLASRRAGEYEARLRRADGEYHWFLFRAIPSFAQDGTVIKWYGTNTDIEERKKVEQDLRRSESYLAEAQRLTQTGSCAIDGSSRQTLYWSEEMFRLLGFDPQLGLPQWDDWLQRVHPDDREMVKLASDRAFLEKQDCEVEFRLVKSNGTIEHIHGIGHPVLSPDGELIQVVGTMVNVTTSKLAEEAQEKIRTLEAELAHINRMTTIGELTASLAHEIKQPIGAAVTNAEACLLLLNRDPLDLTEASDAALGMVKDARRAADIIDRVRALYQKGSSSRQLVQMKDLIREIVVVLLNDAHRQSVTILTDLSDDLPPVEGDRVQLLQALFNLMLNGIEANCGKAGQLTVASRLAENGHIQISVTDTGIGLPPESRERMFDAFFTTKPGGTGLGLAITRSIVESHGGRVWATPNSEGGTTFYFTLPAMVR
jgi:PAS domain S-box-containing protein